MRKNIRNCISGNRNNSTICKLVEVPFKELEVAIDNLKALNFDDIEVEIEEDCRMLNAQCVLDGEEEIYEVTEDDIIHEFDSQYFSLCSEVDRLRKKLYLDCGKCDGMSHLVKVILAEAEFVEVLQALERATRKLVNLD